MTEPCRYPHVLKDENGDEYPDAMFVLEPDGELYCYHCGTRVDTRKVAEELWQDSPVPFGLPDD